MLEDKKPYSISKDQNSSQSPIQTLVEILKDSDLDNEDKKFLIEQAKDRFKVRRRMAYLCLLGIFALGLIDGTSAMQINLAWTNGPLAGVVLAYYGATAYQPNS